MAAAITDIAIATIAMNGANGESASGGVSTSGGNVSAGVNTNGGSASAGIANTITPAIRTTPVISPALRSIFNTAANGQESSALDAEAAGDDEVLGESSPAPPCRIYLAHGSAYREK